MDLIIKYLYTAKFSKQLTFKMKKIAKDSVTIECIGKQGKDGTIILKKVEKGVMSKLEYEEYLADAD